MPATDSQTKAIRYGFLLVPNYSMIAYTSAVDVLRMANRLSEQNLYEWPTYTLDGHPVPASNGLQIIPDHHIDDAKDLTALFVCAGVDVAKTWNKNIHAQLQKAARQKIIMGGLCTGTYLLARSDLLNGYRCTIHWENIASMYEEFPQVIISEELYELDRDRYTCAGGSAPLDMMLQLVRKHSGNKLTIAISEQFMCERIRGRFDRQRVPLRLHLGTGHPKLMVAVSLMEANIEEPISLNELSQHVGVSRRQLERLFQKYLECVPTRYYLQLRLMRARQLLLQTDKSIVDIALACGFVSAPHFSKCYRDMFNIPPRDERSLKRTEEGTKE